MTRDQRIGIIGAIIGTIGFIWAVAVLRTEHAVQLFVASLMIGGGFVAAILFGNE